jgi:hypothetical protein
LHCLAPKKKQKRGPTGPRLPQIGLFIVSQQTSQKRSQLGAAKRIHEIRLIR